MGVTKQRRKRRSRSEWQAIAERFESSGLSKSEFCRREGISEASFAQWRRALGSRSRADFVEWTAPIPQLSSAPLVFGEMELSLPGGVRLRFRV